MKAVILSCVVSVPAQAHVKWFAPYDVAQQPLAIAWMRNPQFIYLMCIALLALTLGVVIENSVIGRVTLIALNRTTLPLRAQTEKILRATLGSFFVALWTVGGIILTPELTTTQQAISWIQLGLAACFLWRPTLAVAGAGIVGLYAFGLYQYGIFHLLDYPIFLGAAAYLILTAFQINPGGLTPLDIWRYATGVTLMWASVEKWAYPDWTYPLFVTHPVMGMGFNPDFYMLSAGVVEFTLAAALLGSSLIRRTSAIMLTTTFVTAVLEFGKVDAIGHSPIIAVLLAIAADPSAGRRWSPAVVPICFLAGFAMTVGAYYLFHLALYPVPT